MRGLTPFEREILIDNLDSPPEVDDDPDDADEYYQRVAARLIARGLLVLVDVEREDYIDSYYQTTDMGRLALRVCVNESLQFT